MIEIAQYGLTKGGHKVDYALVPLERALHMVRQGRDRLRGGCLQERCP